MSTGAEARVGRRRAAPKPSTKGDRRERALLDSAERLLHERPLSELTIEAVAFDAGLSRSAVYFYFASKTALVEALIERATEEIAAFFEAPAPDVDLGKYFEQVLAHVFASWRLHGPVFQAAIEMSITDVVARDRWRAAILRYVDAIVAVAERELCRSGGPHAHKVSPELRVGIESVCWMVERSCYALFTREHSEEDVRCLHFVLRQMALGLTDFFR